MSEEYLSTSVLEVSACLKLLHWHGVSLQCKRQVIEDVESCFQALSLNRQDWEVYFQGKLRCKGLPSDSNIDVDLKWLRQSSHYFLPINCVEYPKNLRDLNDAPIGLFVKGDISALSIPQVAIVGSRRHTPAGKKIAMQFSKKLVSSGLGITSGMALGIDASAHQACCDNSGQTIAVAGCGLDIIYPRQNVQLAHNIVQNGCLVSEFPIGTPPKKENFPARNRIISGLSVAVIVVEAAQRSGSLITARLAAEQGKDVFAVPGSVLSVQSQGCNWLIQQGAILLRNIDELLFELQLPLQNMLNASLNEDDGNLSHDNADSNTDNSSCPILSAISYSETSIDELLSGLTLDFDFISARLTQLELDGLIVRGHNGCYIRVS